MYIIKLDAIDSTNVYLKAMTAKALPADYTVVMAQLQTEGRGQMGTSWQGKHGENLTVSVFKRLANFEIEKQFHISMVVSMAICKTLGAFKIPNRSIKWPNDILSADQKICGILIENVIKSNKFQGSIIGFGLNVNQKFFDNLPKASSLQLLTGSVQNKDEVLSEVLKNFQFYFKKLEAQKFEEIKSEYEALLFRKDKPSTFKSNDNSIFPGIIKGVDQNGKLMVLLEDEIVRCFNLKEITLLY